MSLLLLVRLQVAVGRQLKEIIGMPETVKLGFMAHRWVLLMSYCVIRLLSRGVAVRCRLQQ